MMPARSHLFVPGDRPDRFAKAFAAGADVVILDLEDGVADANKPAARDAVALQLESTQPAWVRINEAKFKQATEDVKAILGCPGLRGVVVPKANDPAEIAELHAQIGDLEIMLLIESASGVWSMRDLAEAPGVTRLALGTVDLQTQLGLEDDNEALIYARSRMVLASSIAGISPPVDGIAVDFTDHRRLLSSISYARSIGFGGKLCIHPTQVSAVNHGFSVSAEERAWARKVISSSQATSSGSTSVEGKLVDKPIVERARRIVSP